MVKMQIHKGQMVKDNYLLKIVWQIKDKEMQVEDLMKEIELQQSNKL